MQNLYFYVIISINDKYTIKLIFLTKIEYNFLYKGFYLYCQGGTMKTWKCTVCGYIHEGDAPPEFCPVCNWGSDKFIQIANYKRKLTSTADKKQDEE